MHDLKLFCMIGMIILLAGCQFSWNGMLMSDAPQSNNVPHPSTEGCPQNLIDIRLAPSADVAMPLAAIPQSLQGVIVEIVPLYSLPDGAINTINSNLRRWFRMTVVANADTAQIIDSLRTAPQIDIAECAPMPAPPPQ